MSIAPDPDLDAAQARCDDVHDLLASIEADLLSWGRRRHRPVAFRRDLRRLRAVANELPDWWHTNTELQVQAAAVMRRPQYVRKFRSQTDEFLSPDERHLLRHFGSHPWFWSLLSVIEPVRGDFYRVAEHLSGRELLMYSPALTATYREGSSLFFTLSFRNGMCCQTFGPLHYFRGYEPFDFTYLAKSLLPDLLRNQGLEAVVAAKPAPFLLLDRWAEIPPVAHSGHVLRVCAHEAKVESFSIGDYAHAFDIRGENREQGILKASLRESNPPIECADVYHDRPGRRLLVVATALQDYREIARLLRGQVDLPDAPEWYATMNMVLAAASIGAKEHPGLAYERRMDQSNEAGSTGANGAELEAINALVAELVRCRNFGEEYSLVELASRFGVTMETARQMEESVEAIGKRNQLDLEGGIDGYRPPPPARRKELQALPSQSDIFVLEYGPEAQQAYAERRERVREMVAEQRAAGTDVSAALEGHGDELSLARLPRLLEDLFFASWRERNPFVLSYTLYLLCQTGDTLQPVRDYAIEVLRMFHQVLFPAAGRAQLEGFIDKYGLFCWEILEPLGLIEIEGAVGRYRAADADYRMWGGPLLDTFVRLSPEWQ